MTSILITGANRGLGLELCKQALESGWDVFAVCRQPDKATELQSLKTTHKQLKVFGCDVNEAADIKKLATILANIPLDILYNNAGIYGPSDYSWREVDTQAWLNVFAVNAIAPLLVCNALFENLKLGKLKIIANMSSLMGSMTDNKSGGSYIYRSSKAALNAVTKSLSVDLSSDKMTVVAIHPGWVQTDMGGKSAPLKPHESITGILNVLKGLSLSDSGKFYNFDGSELRW